MEIACFEGIAELIVGSVSLTNVFLKLFVKYLCLDAPLSLELKIYMIDRHQLLKLTVDGCDCANSQSLFAVSVEFVGQEITQLRLGYSRCKIKFVISLIEKLLTRWSC